MDPVRYLFWIFSPNEADVFGSNKHKDHWKPFDRKHHPKFMICGEMGLDDKRDFPLDCCIFGLLD